jgi:hypothetical protein
LTIGGQTYARLAPGDPRSPASIGASASASPANPPRAVAAPYAAQIFASPSLDAARSALADLRRQQAGALTGLTADIQSTSVGGATMFRALVEGFQSEDAARSFCARLSASGAPCFVRGAPATAR